MNHRVESIGCAQPEKCLSTLCCESKALCDIQINERGQGDHSEDKMPCEHGDWVQIHIKCYVACLHSLYFYREMSCRDRRLPRSSLVS